MTTPDAHPFPQAAEPTFFVPLTIVTPFHRTSRRTPRDSPHEGGDKSQDGVGCRSVWWRVADELANPVARPASCFYPESPINTPRSPRQGTLLGAPRLVGPSTELTWFIRPGNSDVANHGKPLAVRLLHRPSPETALQPDAGHTHKGTKPTPKPSFAPFYGEWCSLWTERQGEGGGRGRGRTTATTTTATTPPILSRPKH